MKLFVGHLVFGRISSYFEFSPLKSYCKKRIVAIQAGGGGQKFFLRLPLDISYSISFFSIDMIPYRTFQNVMFCSLAYVATDKPGRPSRGL